jgi:hypothetical protein
MRPSHESPLSRPVVHLRAPASLLLVADTSWGDRWDIQRARIRRCCSAGRAGASAARPTSPPATDPSRWRWVTSTATATPTWRSPTAAPTTSRCCSAERAGAQRPDQLRRRRRPRSVAVGDFNGDGDPDLAVANRGSDNVSVLLNSPNRPRARPTTRTRRTRTRRLRWPPPACWATTWTPTATR